MKTNYNLPKDLVVLKRLSNTKVLWEWCRNMRPHLIEDVSNYAPGRYRLWLFHEVDFRNGRLTKAYIDKNIWDFAQMVYPGSNIGLLTYGGKLGNGKVSNGKIGLHRDHTYASPKAVSVNLGECVFTHGEPTQRDYCLVDGHIAEFNCKAPHSVKEIRSEERFSIVFWQLNTAKGFNSLLD